MGLGDWACLQIETQEVDLSWNSLSQGLPRWSCRQSMVYLMLLSPAFQEQYIGRMCAYLNFRTFQLHDVGWLLRWTRYPALKQLILVPPTGLEQGRFGLASAFAMFENDHFLQPHQRAERKPLAFVLFREALLSGCQIYHERFEGPIKAWIIVLILTRVVPHVRRRCTFSEKSRIAMAWHVKLYPCNPCTS